VRAHLACANCGWQAGHIIARSLASWDSHAVAAAAACAWNADVAIEDPRKRLRCFDNDVPRLEITAGQIRSRVHNILI
jgi:hypothetical protein